ncbi:hypothetical protein [Nonomuraea guangzhouensis]|uniref:REase associating with pPIWI RE domain-containing protein n=1 Tax=Nonomuraea guangzhouensis TaxID=1291555 RepID=A0ABW4GSF1_9ACTN|nr:hypothetical protein [Nonomuraea guangzhouensis]
MGEPKDYFLDLLRGWVQGACREWGYSEISESYFAGIYQRLPAGVRALVAAGYREGLIEPVGTYRFTLRGLPPGKGPYAWVSRHARTRVPSMNWEYLVQAAEYARVYAALSPKGYLVAAEDRLMDITISESDGTLKWYIEVKERASEVPDFVRRLAEYGLSGVDLDAPDRANDALRKAKYLVLYRPVYLSISAIGLRRDFQVTYPADNRFALVDDMVPLA